tara:strand:+ start:928 stop:1434 length:507 start_codon:yes stop_codon:yes gene_type:complete
MIKEKENIESHCFEKLKKDLDVEFENFQGSRPYVQTGLNFKKEIDEKIVFSYENDFQIDVRKGEQDHELILSGIQSYYIIEDEIGDILLKLIVNFVYHSLKCLPQFTLEIRNFEIGFDGFVHRSNLKDQIKYFEKYGFKVLSETENSSLVVMKLDYTSTELNHLLYSD